MSASLLSPDERLLAELIRVGYFEIGPAVPPGIDWDKMVTAARRHQVAPLLYFTCRRAGWLNALPSSTQEILRKEYLANAVVNGFKTREVAQLQTSFNTEQIAVVWLKGCALAASLYPDPACRVMSDLDFLVEKPDLARLQVILERLGYRAFLESARDKYDTFLSEHVYQPGTNRQSVLEPHWHLLNLANYARRVPVTWFWARITHVQFVGVDGMILSPGSQLLHLAAHHYVHHSGISLRWSFDIALLLDKLSDEIPWEDTAVAAKQFGLLLPLQAALAATAEIWGISPSPPVMRKIKEMQASFGERFDFSMMMSLPPESRVLWETTTLTGWRNKLRYLWSNLFPNMEYMRERYGITERSALPSFYLRRLARASEYFFRWLVVTTASGWRLFYERLMRK